MGYKTIADVMRARFMKALDAERARDPQGVGAQAGLGFRYFRLVESSRRRWSGLPSTDAAAYAEQVDAFADTLVHGFDALSVIWEVALREGFGLLSEVEEEQVENGQTVARFWKVADRERGLKLTVCLDDRPSLAVVQALGLTRSDLFVCRDRALDDTLAANLALQCRLKVL